MLYLIAFTFALDTNPRLVQPAEVLPPGERTVQLVKEQGWCVAASGCTAAGRAATRSPPFPCVSQGLSSFSNSGTGTPAQGGHSKPEPAQIKRGKADRRDLLEAGCSWSLARKTCAYQSEKNYAPSQLQNRHWSSVTADVF